MAALQRGITSVIANMESQNVRRHDTESARVTRAQPSAIFDLLKEVQRDLDRMAADPLLPLPLVPASNSGGIGVIGGSETIAAGAIPSANISAISTTAGVGPHQASLLSSGLFDSMVDSLQLHMKETMAEKTAQAFQNK